MRGPVFAYFLVFVCGHHGVQPLALSNGHSLGEPYADAIPFSLG